MGIKNMDEARRIMREVGQTREFEAELGPKLDLAKEYAANLMEELESLPPATAFMACILMLTGVVGATTADHGPDVQKFVEDEAIKLFKKNLESLREFMAEKQAEKAMAQRAANGSKVN